MKIRSGFVSNSSSTSFTCDVCGETQSGWDMGLSESKMCTCENGHMFCESHFVSDNEFVEFYKFEDHIDKKNITDQTDFYAREMVSSQNCPICTFTYINQDVMLEFLKYKFNISVKEIHENIRKEFKDYNEFRDVIERVC